MFLQSQKHHILVVIFEGDLQKRPPDFGLRDLHKEMEVPFLRKNHTMAKLSCSMDRMASSGTVPSKITDTQLFLFMW